MTREEISEKVKDFLVEEFEIEESEITPDANLKDSLELDSLDYVDLVVNIESSFGFKIEPEDFTKIITFNDFYDYIHDKLSSE